MRVIIEKPADGDEDEIIVEKQVYEIRRKLYELEENFENSDFLRISKSTIVNVSKIVKLEPYFNSRLEAVLENGERTIISRQYVPDLKRKLRVEEDRR